MKIFNIENGIEKLYIQQEDLMNLCDTTRIPQSIYDIYKFSLIYCKSNKDFIEYTNPKDIEYLNSIDWILDYREYTFKEVEELIMLAKHYEVKINELANAYNDMSRKERIKNYNLKLEHDHLTYKYYSLIYLINIKNTKDKIKLPTKIDYKGITFFDNKHNYIMYASLDSDVYIIERRDLKNIKEDEIIPNEFINKCIKYILFYNDNEDIESITPYYDEKEKNVKIKISKNIKTLEESTNDLIELKSNDSMVKKLVNKFKRD